MAEDRSKSANSDQQDTLDQPLDLSVLESLQFGPDWSDSAAKNKAISNRADTSGGRGGGGGPRERRDRRPPRGDRSDHGGGRSERDSRGGFGGGGGGFRGGGGDRQRRGGPRGHHQRAPERPFRPVVEVAFYPEDAPFKAMTKAVRHSHRTFELFEIARLILEKPERFVIVLRRFENEADHPFYVSKVDGVPFDTEEAALQHAVSQSFPRYFNADEVEVEPPKGSFQMINRCRRTGELLGPPNYHRYQQILQEHHAAHFSHLAFEDFTRQIEGDRSQETIDAWMEKMKTQTRYTLKGTEGENAQVFETAESARQHLLVTKRQELITTTDSARVPGKSLDVMPRGELRQSVEAALEHQRHFPLDTANHLRSRLRRMHFTIYKRGSKGVSYVCAVKRRFRTPGQTFADSIQMLIEFIEAHPNINAAQLSEELYGIRIPEKTPAAPPEPAKTEAPANEEPTPATTDDPAEATATAAPEEPTIEESSAAPTEEIPPTEEAPVSESVAEAEIAPEPAPTPPEPAAAAPQDGLSPEEHAQLHRLTQDLHWLVAEGYVTEYSDGSLHAPPPQAPPAPKKQAAPKAQEEAPEETAESDAATDVPPVSSESTSETEAISQEPLEPVEENTSEPEKTPIAEASPEEATPAEPTAENPSTEETASNEETVETPDPEPVEASVEQEPEPATTAEPKKD